MEAAENLKKFDTIAAELFEILPDFKLVQAKVPLFDSNYKYFSYIFLELRDLVLKEISKSLEPVKFDQHKQTESLENEKKINKAKFKELEMAIESVRSKADNINQETNSNIRAIDRINDNIESIKEDLLNRVPFHDFNDLRLLVETKASIANLQDSENFLNAEIEKKTYQSDFLDLSQKFARMQEELKAFASLDFVQEKDRIEREYVDNRLADFVVKEEFKYFKEDVQFRFSDVDLKIERSENIQGFANDTFRKELARLEKAVKKRPWKKDIEVFRMNLQEAAKIIEFQRHKETIVDNLNDFRAMISSFGQRCDNYERVLARFDEILLDKASKDDISQLSKVLPSFAKKSILDETSKELMNNLTFVQEKLDDTLEKFNKSEVLISQVNAAFRNFKNDNKESIQMKNSILDLQSRVESKAEKIDLLAISDSIVRKDDFLPVKSSNDLLRRQFEMQIAIVHAVMRTMTKSNDSAVFKNKQRVELLRNMGNLMNWVGINPGSESLSYLPTLNSGLLQRSHAEIDQILPSIKHPRKLSMGEIDAPKFKGKYEI